MKDVENGSRKIVGVNHGVMDENSKPEVMKLDPTVGEEQTEKLRKLRENRNTMEVNSCLQRISEASAGSENLMPLVIDAVKANCTLGEIMNAMKEHFGTYMAPSGF